MRKFKPLCLAVIFMLLLMVCPRSEAALDQPVKIYGYVRDGNNNPIPASVSVIDESYNNLGSVQTDANGYFELEIPERKVYSVQASAFVSRPQDYVEITGGYRVSRYMQLQKAIIPVGSQVEVNFTLPPAAALWVLAYDISGKKMLMGDIDSQINLWGDRWYGQVYGVFPIENITVPTGASVGQFRGAWHPEKWWTEWEPTFAVPPGEPVYLTMLWPVSSMGTTWLRADNEGQGYSLGRDEVRQINLVFEFAKTEYKQALKKKENYELQGYSFSSEVADWLSQAGENLNEAKLQIDEKNRALLSHKVLELSMKATERMTLEAAERGIERRRENIVVIVKDEGGKTVPGAEVKYNQTSLDFVRGYGFADWSGQPPASVIAGREMGYQYLYYALSWREVEPQKGTYDFSKIDSYLEKANKQGYEVIVCLLWVGGGSNDGATWKNYPDWTENLEFQEFNQSLYLFTKKAVEHLKGKVKYLIPAVELSLLTRTGSRYLDVDFKSDYAGAVKVEELIQLTKTVFQAARDANSGILLGYSENPSYAYFHLNPLSFGGFPSPYYLMKLMLENGVRPDFIGVESHYGTIQAPVALSHLVDIIQDFRNLSNLPVLLVEASSYPSRAEDYGLTGPAPNVYWHEGMTQKAQAEWNTAVFKIAMSLPYVIGVQMIHITAEPLKLEWAPKLYGGTLIGTDFITQGGQPKQVYYAMKDLFDSWTAKGSQASAEGSVSFTGFSGEYSIEISKEGYKTLRTTIHVTEGENNVFILTLGAEAPQKPLEAEKLLPLSILAIITVAAFLVLILRRKLRRK